MTLYCDKCGASHDSSVCPSCSGFGKSRPMTAPDVNDVRARFELVMVSAVSPQNNAPYGTFPSYEQAEAVAKLLLKADAEDSPEWCGYLIDRAAHADLSGEVRELVEAADSSGEYLDAYLKAFYSSQPADWMDAALLAKLWHCRIKAALAKFHPTHQEKP